MGLKLEQAQKIVAAGVVRPNSRAVFDRDSIGQ